MATSPPNIREAFARVDDALQRQSFEEALALAAPWAQMGHGWAEACVGSLYQCGLGVAMNRATAIRYFERAAVHGFPGAWHSLGVIYEAGDQDVPPDTGRADECYKKARECGYVPGEPFHIG